ncbi:MAG: glucuronate isomerase [Propionibacteriaceae bacterium]|nr:glucuronate isomerase [Propionibacteriaceae bacterium]
MCGLVGEWVERGEITSDIVQLAQLVRSVSYFNAKQCFAI